MANVKDGERLTRFWGLWGHKPSDHREFIKFRNRAIEVARTLWTAVVKFREPALKRFALLSGTRYPGVPTDYSTSSLRESLERAETVFEVVEALQLLLWTLESISIETMKWGCVQLNQVLDVSPNVPVRIVLHGTTATLYPSGAELLDKELVESSLVWLDQYPDALKPFEEALKIYLKKDKSQYRNMLDSLRLALEQILRAVLGNEKSLENQKAEFLRWLAKHGAHSQIVGMYNDLLTRFAKYQNDAVKHGEDEYTPAEVEFVLYATGTFLRFIQRASEQDGPTLSAAGS